MEKILKNYSLNLTYQILVAVIPIVFLPFISRSLGASAVGIYSYVISFASFFTIIGLLGMNTYSTREVAYRNTDIDSVKQIFQDLFTIRIVLFVIVSIVYFTIISFNQYKVLFSIYYLAIIGSFFDISWLFTGIEQMKTVVVRNLIVKIANFILILVFIRTPDDLWKYVLITGASALCGICVMYPSARMYFKGYRPKIVIPEMLMHIKNAFRLFLPQMASQIYVQCDKVMMMWLATSVSLGFYEQSEKIAKMPIALISALSIVMMPRISNELRSGTMRNAQKYFRFGCYVMELFMIPVTFGLLAVGRNFLILYLGAEFADATSIFSVIVFCIIPISLSNITGSQFLVALDKTKILTVSYTLAAILNVACNAILIPLLGGVGAAVATVAAECVVASIQYVGLQKYIEVHKELSHTFLSAVLALAMYFILRFMGNVLAEQTLLFWLITEVIIGVFIYYGLYFAINRRRLVALFCLVRDFKSKRTKDTLN